MRRKARILPPPGYVYTAPIERIIPQLERIIPSSDYKPMTLHARALQASGAVKNVEAEWCPVCLGRHISERLSSGRPVWHCDDCGNEW